MNRNLFLPYQPDSYPPTVYKLRQWDEEQKNIITNREIYFAKPSSFGSFSETGELKRNYNQELPNEEQVYENAYRDLKSANPQLRDRNIRRLANRKVQKHKKKFWNNLEHVQRINKKYDERLDDSIGVFSTAENIKSVSLWDTFGDLGSGFAIGIDTDKLISNQKIIGSAGKVNYFSPENEPKLNLITNGDMDLIYENVLNRLYFLPLQLKQEEEYRFTKMIKNSRGKVITSRKAILPPDYYKEVILGYDISNDDKAEIIDAVNANLPKVPIKEAVFNDETKEIEIHTI